MPLYGTINVPFDFSKISGTTIIIASACCGGHCRTVEKLVYKDPEDDSCNVKAGKPVSVANGNVFLGETDFSLSGIMPANFTRYYFSKGSTVTGLGQMWSHTFDTRVISFGVNTYKVVNPDGSIVYYTDNDGDKIYDAALPKGERSKLTKNPNNTFVREFFDGTKEEYNTGGYLTAMVDRNGTRITLTRGTNNYLTTITDPSGRAINITNNTSGKITSITLPDGKVFSYTYLTGTGFLGKVTYPDGSMKNYEYVYKTGTGWRLSGVKNENGNYIETHTYDAQGRAITSSADGTNEKLTIAYVGDAYSTVTDSLGRVTTYTIDKTGGKSHATSISGPGCKECGQGDVSYTYDNNLNITSSTDANGNVTTMTYDSNGNMLTKTEAYGTSVQRTTTYTYNSLGQPLTITDPSGNVTTYTYDLKGNLLTTVDAAGDTTTFTYNAVGLMTSMADPQNNTTTYAYDQYGNLSSVTDPLGHTTTNTYDVMGKLLSMTDANGNQTTYTYDQRGRLTQVKDNLNQITNYIYDPAGNLTAITDAKNNTTQFTYDSINRLIGETNALGNQRNYTYNTESNLTTKTDAKGQATSYIYDDHNRLTTINHPDSTQTTFSYDNIGNITSAANPNISYTLAYDPLKRKTSVTDSLGRTLGYTYDANSNKVSMTDPSGGVTQYTYNRLNLLTAIRDPLNQTTSYTYDNLRRRRGLALPNGITTSYTYDNVSRLLSIINGSISTNRYVYDNIGNRTSMKNTPKGIHNYGYDAIYRLLQATHPAQPTEQFTYDPVGNRQTDGSGNSYFYNNVNRLLNYNGVTFEYDANGNTVTKINGTGTTRYTYDSENRLTRVDLPNGDVATYKYDPFGRRIEKSVNGTIEKYVYDEEDILAEYDGNNQLIARYTHGPGIDEPISMEKSGQKYYYHFDGLGSVTGITDSTGNVVQRYEYDSFGNIVSMSDPNFIQPYTYTGREYDPESGLYFYRARYYDEKVGRFISEDPIGLKGGDVNLYAYVKNRPTMLVDPLGLAGCGPFGMSIPDPWGLSECCDAHDNCYDKCEGRKKCDETFCTCMKNKCSKLAPQDGEACNCRASRYCSAVKGGGWISYYPSCGSFQ